MVSRLRKPSAALEKITVPNSARTIDGIPAITSIVDSAARASATGRPNSRQPDGDRDPRPGGAIAIAIAATIAVPISGSRMPPVASWLKPAFGGVVSSSRLTYLIPWTRK